MSHAERAFRCSSFCWSFISCSSVSSTVPVMDARRLPMGMPSPLFGEPLPGGPSPSSMRSPMLGRGAHRSEAGSAQGRKREKLTRLCALCAHR